MGKKCKKFIKKVLAVTLTAAMTLSIAAVSDQTTAYAAVKLSKTTKTLTVGKSFKLTLKKNKKNWYINKATAKKPSVAKVTKQTRKFVKVKGKAAGKTKIRVVLKKKGKTTKKVLTCQVKVVPKKQKTPTVPSTPSTPTVPSPSTSAVPSAPSVQEEVTVSTQAELDAALTNRHLTKITIDTLTQEQFVIPKGTYSDVDLIVNAPASDVENSGVFRSIQINAIKPDTWIENAIGNALHVLAEASRIVVTEDAEVKDITYAKVEASASLEIYGKVANISVKTKTMLSISGTPKNTPKVTVEETATDTEITSKAPIDVMVLTSTTITLEEGAEGSSVEVGKKDISITVTNRTTAIVPVKKADGSTVGVRVRQTLRVASSQTQTSTGSYPYPSPTIPSSPVVNTPTSGAINGGVSDTINGGVSDTVNGGGVSGPSDYEQIVDGSGDPISYQIPSPTPSEMQEGVEATVAIVISGSSITSCVASCTLTVILKEDMPVPFTISGGSVQISSEIDGVQVKNWKDLDSTQTTTYGENEQKLTLDSSADNLVEGWAIAFRYRSKDNEYSAASILTVNDYVEDVLREYLQAYTKTKYYKEDGPVYLAWTQPVNTLDLTNPNVGTQLTYRYDSTIPMTYSQQDQQD